MEKKHVAAAVQNGINQPPKDASNNPPKPIQIFEDGLAWLSTNAQERADKVYELTIIALNHMRDHQQTGLLNRLYWRLNLNEQRAYLKFVMDYAGKVLIVGRWAEDADRKSNRATRAMNHEGASRFDADAIKTMHARYVIENKGKVKIPNAMGEVLNEPWKWLPAIRFNPEIGNKKEACDELRPEGVRDDEGNLQLGQGGWMSEEAKDKPPIRAFDDADTQARHLRDIARKKDAESKRANKQTPAQRMKAAIETLAKEPEGDKRNDALKDAAKVLYLSISRKLTPDDADLKPFEDAMATKYPARDANDPDGDDD